MDKQVNERGFWQKVNRGGLLLLLLLAVAAVFLIVMRIEENRIENIAGAAIAEYNETLSASDAEDVPDLKNRRYYEYNVSYESLDRITVSAQYVQNYTSGGDYFELERSGGRWQVVFSRYGAEGQNGRFEGGYGEYGHTGGNTGW